MATFKVKKVNNQKVLVIDGEVFDWGLDDDSLYQVNQFKNEETIKAVHADIKNFFLESLIEFLGFKVTMGDVNKALESGHIDDPR